ncbi:MAG: UDP-N-acetylglucosamine 2-epimerase (non-hydrolyzing) [Phycisphaerales bacterium]|nr:MAG: UDP-N-acetylglucosamine 2-epimerase (non-hydrolyzing) [Phycisphaerales bacterium]
MVKIATIVGARPQFIKAAVVSRVIRERNREVGADEGISESIIHTGQHFDTNMSEVFFEEMDIPRPDHHLGIGGGSHGQMTGRMIERIEAILTDDPPDWVLVYGDTNSTLAGALAAVKLHIPLAHVEAGLRSFNRRMPEEINRVLTDHAANLVFAPTDVAVQNLKREGIDPKLIARVGDVMYDAMLFYRSIASDRSTIISDLGLTSKQYVLATVHRAENTDDPVRLKGIMDGLAGLNKDLAVVLPLHPRTRKMLSQQRIIDETSQRIRLIDPVGYLDMVMLEASAALIATDSGGVQKEAYFNRVPCLTLRDETEWVELVTAGANRVVGTDPRKIVEAGTAALQTRIDQGNLYGDGRAGEAIIDRLLGE